MRFEALELLAFGPFTDRRLDLRGDFHLIYGPNEAGKSSALRAIVDVLFGIPLKTADDHVHDMPALRIGAQLSGADGRALRFVRRKGTKSTLLDVEGRPLAEDALAPFLGAVTRESFLQMFGLDHVRFRESAQGLISPDSTVGGILVGASLGTRALERAQERLKKEADALYTRGPNSKRRIHELLREHEGAVGRTRDATLAAEDWRQRVEALAERIHDRDRLARERHDLSIAQTRLGRVQRTLPRIRAWERAQEAHAALGEGLRLAPDASERRKDALRERDGATRTETDAVAELARLERELAERRPAEALLAAQALIRGLAERRSAAVTSARELTRLEIELAEDERVIAAQEKALAGRPALPDRAQRARIQALARERARIDGERAAAEAERERVGRALQAVDREEAAAREEAGDPDALRALANRGQRLLASEPRRAELSREQARAEAERSARLASLTPPPPPGLVPPSAETVERYAAIREALARAADKLDERDRAAAAQRAELRRTLDVLLSSGAPPTEAELTAARKARDAALRARLGTPGRSAAKKTGRGAVPEGALPLPFDLGEVTPPPIDDSALWRSVSDADVLVDRLRRDSARVAQRAALEAELEAQDRDDRERAQERAAHQARVGETEAAWRAEWGGLAAAVRTPREMQGWIERDRERRLAEARALEAAQAGAALDAEAEALVIAVRAALGEAAGATAGATDGSPPAHGAATPGAVTASLASPRAPRPLAASSSAGLAVDLWAARAEQQARRIDEARRAARERATERRRLETEQEAADRRCQAVAAEATTWAAQWQQALAQLGQPPDTATDAATDVIAAIEALHARSETRSERLAQQRAHQAQARGFAADVERLVTQLAAAVPVAVSGATPVQRLEILQGQLQTSLEDAAVVRRLEESLTRARRTARDAAARRAAAEAELQALMARAQVADLPALEAAEAREHALHQAEALRARAEAELIAAGGGLELASLISEARGQLPDQVEAELTEVTARLLVVEEEIAALNRAIGQETGRQHGKQEQGAAAAAAEEAQAVLAELRRQVDRYALLKLGAAVLHRHAERFRETHEGPLLGRAGRHLAALTRGALVRLETGLDGDKPVLLAVREGGARVGLTGMSDGTRDQVYLALRLATFEAYLDQPRSEPMPLVVDDILLHFDDERAAAALGVLGELSARTQVLFFTHHHRLVELARARVPRERLVEHDLGARPAPLTLALEEAR